MSDPQASYNRIKSAQVDADILAAAKRRFARMVYTGADSEMVEWATDDDGSAAHEPYDPDSQFVTVLRNEDNEKRERLANQAEQIGALICRVEQLEREAKTTPSQHYVLAIANARIAALEEENERLRSAGQRQLSDFCGKFTSRLSAFPLNAIKHSL